MARWKPEDPWIRVGAVLCLAMAARATDSVVVSEPSRSRLRVQTGFAQGMDVNRGIRRWDIRAAWEHDFRPSLTGAPEFSVERFEGERGGRDAASTGFTLMYVLTWNAWRGENFFAGIEFGWGGGLYTKAFPAGGTRYNGYSQFGAQVGWRLSPDWSLVADVREMHHSNGRGMVERNPAYDALDFAFGARFGL